VLVLRDVEGRHRLLEELPDHVELPLEASVVTHGGPPADEDLLDHRLDRPRRIAEEMVVGRHVAPAEHELALFLDDRVQQDLHLLALLGIARQEHQAAPVLGGTGKGDLEASALPPQELVGHLQQDAGAVAGVRLAAAGATVQEVDQHLQGLAHDRVRAPALDVDDESDAAGVVLEARVVQTLGGRRARLSGGSALNFRHCDSPL